MTKVGFKTVALSDDLAVLHLANTLSEHPCGKVMIHGDSRVGRSRSHLRLHQDRQGYFVRCGVRGSAKQYLGRCKITYLNGAPILLQFTLADHDAFEAEQQRRWDAKHGIAQHAVGAGR